MVLIKTVNEIEKISSYVLIFLFLLSLQVPCMFVESMLEVHKKYTELIQSVFNNDQKFIQALDKVRLTSGVFFCFFFSFLVSIWIID